MRIPRPIVRAGTCFACLALLAFLLLGGAPFGTTICAQGPPAAKPPFYADKENLLVVQDAEGKTQPIQTAEQWAKRRADILSGMQQVMGTLPADDQKVPLEMRVVEASDQGSVVRLKITFAVAPGDRVPAYLLVPRGGAEKKPAMLCLHQTTAVGKAEPAGLAGSPNLRYALELAQRGYVTLAPDYPMFGEYKLDVYAKGYASATLKGVWNHQRAVDLLQTLPEVDGKRIGVIGHSLGGHNALFLAAFDPRLQAVVTSCGFTSFPKYYDGNLTGWSHKGYMPRIQTVYAKDVKKMPFDFPEVLAAIAPRPVFINAPLHDNNFAVAGVKDCVQAAQPVYRLLGGKDQLVAVYPDSGHDFPPEVRQQAYRFLDQKLRNRN